MWRVVFSIKALVDLLYFLKTVVRLFLLEWKNSNFYCEEISVDTQKELEELDDCIELDLLKLLFDSMVLLVPFERFWFCWLLLIVQFLWSRVLVEKGLLNDVFKIDDRLLLFYDWWIYSYVVFLILFIIEVVLEVATDVKGFSLL